jgi:hypothetical protein
MGERRWPELSTSAALTVNVVVDVDGTGLFLTTLV